MADFTIKRSKPKGASKTRVLSVSGEMTIQHANEIKSALLAAFAEAEHLSLDLGKVTEFDLAGMQLICSAHRAAYTTKKEFTVTGTGSEVFKAAALAAGLPRHIGCAEDVNKTCIWVGGVE
ncbi:MAG: sulfate transporter/antisigma-factor antagonist [Geobacteraceae bacterium]|nr:MAG: sulfate transporter/antisigma-factor antagonist [Geobacteraceae bacterium]